MKTTIFGALVIFYASSALATPPGCLLQAVNTQNEPSNLSVVCGNGAQDIQSHIARNCGTFEETAQKAFINTCSSAGTSVAAYTVSSSSSTSSSFSSVSTEPTATATTTHTSGSESASASSVSSTAGANAENRQAGMGPMAAAVVAMVGAVAAL